MENQANTLLPPDLMLEILLLLPLESILSCKLVSKAWNKLVKHPTFIKLYHNKSSTFFLTGNTLNCLFRPDDDDNTSYKVRRVHIDLTQHRDVTVRIPKLHELLPESSNKIACVRARNGNFLLYNLFTGDSHVVGDAPFRYSAALDWLCYGFGYDRCEDDYKIVVVSKHWSKRYLQCHEREKFDLRKYNERNSLIFVYSYRNRGWKFSDGFPHDAYYWSIYKARAYSFKDVLVWVVNKKNSKLHGLEQESVVVALDIHSYDFVEILLPPPYYGDNSTRKPMDETLTELDGNLCCSYGVARLHVWVMKEYGVPESWTKLFSIRRLRISGPSYPISIKHTALYQCRDHASNIVVFRCYESSMELFRYDIDKDKIYRYDITMDNKDRNEIDRGEIDQHDIVEIDGDRNDSNEGKTDRHHIDKGEIQVLCKATPRQKWRKRALLQWLKTRFKEAFCLHGDVHCNRNQIS